MIHAAAPFLGQRAGTGITQDEEIQSQALTALAWQLNLSKAIQLLRAHLTLRGPALCQETPESGVSTVRMLQHSSKPALPAPGSHLRGDGTGSVAPTVALWHPLWHPSPGCSWRRRLCHQTCCRSPAGAPQARGEAGAGLSSALHLPLAWTHPSSNRSF